MGQIKVVASDGGKHLKPTPHQDTYFKITGDDTDGKFDYFDVRVGSLDGPPLHTHLEQDETFHVISGELRFKVGEQTVDVKEGEYIYIPKGTVHAFVNLKQEPARAVGIVIPGNFDKFLEEMAAYLSSSKSSTKPRWRRFPPGTSNARTGPRWPSYSAWYRARHVDRPRHSRWCPRLKVLIQPFVNDELAHVSLFFNQLGVRR